VLDDLSGPLSGALREAFHSTGYHADGVLELLGAQAHTALGRGEPEPARRATRDAGELGTLVRLLLLGDPEPASAVAAAIPGVRTEDLLAAGLLEPDGDRLRAALDVRPYGDDDGGAWWVFADLDADQRPDRQVPPEHVLGVGHASLSLARATMRRPVGSLLDLGAGCGVQTLHASRHAQSLTATDLSERALSLARATFAINDLDVRTERGSWFEPVAGRRFDQVVCNPPFVVGPARVDFTYRDSGLAGDGASELVVRGLPDVLADGGVGQLLASWLHLPGDDWAHRVAAWLPDTGIDAWFVQRDVADPALYVGTWLRDAGIDPRSAQGAAQASAWLDWFAENDVEGIGFGFVTLRRTAEGTPTHVDCEDLRHAFVDPLGPEAAGWLDRVDWLRRNDTREALLDIAFTVPGTVVLERVAEPGSEGWAELVRRLHRLDGPGWQHEVDELTSALLAGCQGALPLRELLALLAGAHGLDSGSLVDAAVPVVVDLLRHGMLLPPELAG
jgi:methylase of polypeptide subunit release factors